jgi:hypothetical protein
MYYLMPDGSIIVNFEQASTVLNILTAFIEAVTDQPHLHATYLCLHPQLRSDNFDGALLMEDLFAVSAAPLFGLVLNHLEASCLSFICLFYFVLYIKCLSTKPHTRNDRTCLL